MSVVLALASSLPGGNAFIFKQWRLRVRFPGSHTGKRPSSPPPFPRAPPPPGPWTPARPPPRWPGGGIQSFIHIDRAMAMASSIMMTSLYHLDGVCGRTQSGVTPADTMRSYKLGWI